MKIRITVQDVTLNAELFDTACAREIAAALPIITSPNEWGDEFYFEIPVSFPPDETATTRVRVGDIGYWPPGKALAIFFGQTPMSKGNDPVPASAVNLVGKISGDATVLRNVKGAKKILVEQTHCDLPEKP